METRHRRRFFYIFVRCPFRVYRLRYRLVSVLETKRIIFSRLCLMMCLFFCLIWAKGNGVLVNHGNNWFRFYGPLQRELRDEQGNILYTLEDSQQRRSTVGLVNSERASGE